MAATLVYHPADQSGHTSPFDVCILEMVQNSGFSLACPFIGLKYFERLISHSGRDWRVLTDIDAWLNSTNQAERKSILRFVEKHTARFRHRDHLHAKVLLTGTKILLGSANFTLEGLLRRDEMSILLDDPNHVRELKTWFESLWRKAESIDVAAILARLLSLPNPPEISRTQNKKTQSRVSSRLAPLARPAQRPLDDRAYAADSIEAVLAAWPEIADYTRKVMAFLQRPEARPYVTLHTKGDWETTPPGKRSPIRDIRFKVGKGLYAEIRFQTDSLWLVLYGDCNLADYQWEWDSEKDKKYWVHLPLETRLRPSLKKHVDQSYQLKKR